MLNLCTIYNVAHVIVFDSCLLMVTTRMVDKSAVR